MTENELKAKALVIGMKLKGLDWFNCSGTKAHDWCVERAKEMGVSNNNHLDYIACLAMKYVISKTEVMI